MAPTASFSRSMNAHLGAAARLSRSLMASPMPMIGNWRPTILSPLVELPQHGEEIGGGFVQVAARLRFNFRPASPKPSKTSPDSISLAFNLKLARGA